MPTSDTAGEKFATRPQRLNRLSSINQSKRYLEIGVAKGFTFNRVNVVEKVAVDPVFRFDTDRHKAQGTFFFEMTSDAFFTNHANRFDPFDLIHIDGLHTFEQSARDFCASLAHSHRSTIWLIDDTAPESYAQADRSQNRCQFLKTFSGEDDKKWMGDVFKTVAFINDFFPQFSYATFPGHGQTVVWRQSREDFKPRWNSLEAIERMNFAEYAERQIDIFKRESYASIFDRIERALQGTNPA